MSSRFRVPFPAPESLLYLRCGVTASGMKIPPKSADSFSRQPPPEIRAVLVYGPDRGLVHERVDHLIRSVVSDPKDPFRVAELQSFQVVKDPALVADEAAAMAFGGGQRAVCIRDGNDNLYKALSAFLDTPVGDALVIVEGGDLDGKSKLRQIFEKAKGGAALPCYRDDQRSLPGLIQETIKAEGLDISQEAIAYLASNLGGDRLVTRGELQKLALYAGRGRIEVEDARACVGDTAERTLEDIAFAVGSGDVAGLERAYQRAIAEGASPIQPLRAAARHFQRLHAVTGNNDPDTAMKRLRPPVFWKREKAFRTQTEAWSPNQLARALERLLEAEKRTKTSGLPATAIASRALMEIAHKSPCRRRQRA